MWLVYLLPLQVLQLNKCIKCQMKYDQPQHFVSKPGLALVQGVISRANMCQWFVSTTIDIYIDATLASVSFVIICTILVRARLPCNQI